MSFSFGTPSSAPANSSLTGGFSFGANKPTTLPGFGLSASSQPSTGLFGSTPASSTPAFGASTTFGAPSTSAFGATATPGFGATSTALTFGTGSTTAPAFGTALGTGGLNFGAGSNAAASTGLTLGAPAATSTGLGGFGATTQSTGLFGATTQATGLFGATTPATGLFGATTQATGLFGATSSAPAGGGLFGAKLGSSTLAGGLTTTTPSVGLGGAAPFGSATTYGDSKTEPPKQAKVPNELAVTVDSFKDFVKRQKAISAELMSVSVKPLYNVSREAELCARALQAVCSEVSRARAQSRRLRAAAACTLSAAEGQAQGQGDGSIPPTYVVWLVGELEQILLTCRRQLDVAHTQMHAAPNTRSEQELTLGIRRMHESLVALAGRLQTLHTLVDAQRHHYLTLRKHMLNDPTNVFETTSTTTSLEQILRDAERSRKKGNSTRWSGGGSAVLRDPRAALGTNVQQLTGPSPFSYIGSTLSPFPAADSAGNTGWQAPCASTAVTFAPRAASPPAAGTGAFTLQRPPGKRGKQ